MRFFVFFSVFLLLASVVGAVDDVELGTLKAKVKSPFYKVGKLFEPVRLVFAGSEGKALLRYEFVENRLVEVLVALEKNDAVKVNKLLSKIEVLKDKIKVRVDKVPKADLSEKQVKFIGKIEARNERNKEVLEDIITRFENDDNKNNDNALTGLKTALEKHKIVESEVSVRKEIVMKNEVSKVILSSAKNRERDIISKKV